LSTAFNLAVSWRTTMDLDVNEGCGFLDGNGPAPLPSHTTFDLWPWENLSVKSSSLRLTGLNLANHRYLLDNRNSFGGTHFVNAREISVELKYRFGF
jgi:hypothetical protein